MKFRKFSMPIIVLILCCAMSVQAFAFYPEDEVSSVNQDTVSYEGQTYVKCEEFETVCEDIYLLGNQYVMRVTNPEKSVLIPVERVDVAFTNNVAVTAFMGRDDIPQEAKDSFAKKYQAYMAASEDYDITPALVLFEPDVSLLSASGDPDNILYYTYNGWPMMTYQFIYTNLSTGWKNIKTGTGTKDKVALVYDVALSVGSLVSNRLSYFSTGQSILTSFLNYYGLTSNNVTTDVEDYFQARLVWDQTEQYTMTDYGGMTGWQTGLVTYKVTVKKLGQETYFANSGELPYTTDKIYNTTVKSTHYDDPWATSFSRGSYNTLWEYVSWSTGDVSYDFS